MGIDQLLLDEIDTYLMELVMPMQIGDSGGFADMDLPNPLLCDRAHLEIFGLWWTMQGYERRPSMEELANTPAAMAKDFQFLLKRTRFLEKAYSNGYPESY